MQTKRKCKLKNWIFLSYGQKSIGFYCKWSLYIKSASKNILNSIFNFHHSWKVHLLIMVSNFDCSQSFLLVKEKKSKFPLTSLDLCKRCSFTSCLKLHRKFCLHINLTSKSKFSSSIYILCIRWFKRVYVISRVHFIWIHRLCNHFHVINNLEKIDREFFLNKLIVTLRFEC